MRKTMDVAIFWLVIFGPILIGLAIAAWYGGQKTLGLWTGFLGILFLVLTATLQIQLAIWKSQTPAAETNSFIQGIGGKGGDAKVFGNGTAIAGSGGQGGKYGKGGDGGSAEVHGNGLAAGGAGGAAGDDGVWRAPAKSGYEIAQRAQGLPVDPNLRQYGRGGAMPGYEPKLKLVEQLRSAYFIQHSKIPQTIFENINAVPLDYINKQLVVQKQNWRVRIVDDEYEFFVPQN